MAPEDFFELAGLDGKEIGFTCEAASMGGWALEMLGRIPQEGDSYQYDRFTVTVGKVEDQRILNLVVRLAPEAPPESKEKSSRKERASQPGGQKAGQE